MDSIWTKEVELPHFPTLEGEVNTDVLIIGGGITGILCAYFLQENGGDYVLPESNTIASGTTRNTTAKITLQHGLIYHKLQELLFLKGRLSFIQLSLYLSSQKG